MVLPMHNETLFSHKKNKIFVICNSKKGTGAHYVKWNKPGTERQSHLYVESKKVYSVQVESRMIVTRGWGQVGVMGRCWSTGPMLQLDWSFGIVLLTMVTTENSYTLYISLS
jgi:hypothetical protein